MALAHALMSLLITCPSSGYDLTKRFDQAVGFFWKASPQQIYRELTRLEELEWLSAQTILQEHRPDKKIFSVTELGKQKLQAWVREPVPVSPLKDDLLVKIYCGHIVPKSVILQELRQHQKDHQGKLVVYQELEQRYFSDPAGLNDQDRFVYLTLRNGLQYEVGWLTWCAEAIALLETTSPPQIGG